VAGASGVSNQRARARLQEHRDRRRELGLPIAEVVIGVRDRHRAASISSAADRRRAASRQRALRRNRARRRLSSTAPSASRRSVTEHADRHPRIDGDGVGTARDIAFTIVAPRLCETIATLRDSAFREGSESPRRSAAKLSGSVAR
jgi:hypothetical protein